MIEIRNASASDIPTIQEMAEKTWWVVYPPILEKEQIAHMLATIYSADVMHSSMQNNSQIFLILSDDGASKGFASYGPWAEDQNIWKIHKLYILPDCQGRGFGRRMIDEVRSRADNINVNAIVLNVNRFNPAVNFYLRYGFKIIREEDIPIGEFWMNDFVMRLDI